MLEMGVAQQAATCEREEGVAQGREGRRGAGEKVSMVRMTKRGAKGERASGKAAWTNRRQPTQRCKTASGGGSSAECAASQQGKSKSGARER